MNNTLRKAGITAAALMASAAPALAQSIDEKVNQVFANSTGWFVNLIFSPFPGTEFPWIVAWLVIAATIFTFYFGLIQFKAFPHSIALVKGDYSDPNDAGEVSHFQALATALSGTVGLGNIAGVAVAVGIGGPGGDVLDDPCGSDGHGLEVHRMYAGREIPERIRKRHRFRWSDVLYDQGL